MNSGNGFAGLLEGLGNPISGLTLNRPSVSAAGLFGAVGSTGILRSVVVANAGVDGDGDVGELAAINAGTFAWSSASGTITGSNYVGGLAGGTAASGVIAGA